MGWSRAEAAARRRAFVDRNRAALHDGLEPEEQILAESWTFLLSAERIRSIQPRPVSRESSVIDVGLDAVRAWHVSWSHDGRPTLVLDHGPVIRQEISSRRTVLWFHLGGKPYGVERSSTSVPFSGRREQAYRMTIDLLGSLAIPRGPDEQRTLMGTRDERLGASVSPLLLLRTGSHADLSRPFRTALKRFNASGP